MKASILKENGTDSEEEEEEAWWILKQYGSYEKKQGSTARQANTAKTSSNEVPHFACQLEELKPTSVKHTQNSDRSKTHTPGQSNLKMAQTHLLTKKPTIMCTPHYIILVTYTSRFTII